MVYLTDSGGNVLVYVFASPGRIWKDRWVAFTNSDQFVYHKGSKDSAFNWAKEYIRMVEGDGIEPSF